MSSFENNKSYEEFKKNIVSELTPFSEKEKIEKIVNEVFQTTNINIDAHLKSIAKDDKEFAQKRYQSFFDNLTEALKNDIGAVEKIANEKERLQGVVYNKIKELTNKGLSSTESINRNKDLNKEQKEFYITLRENFADTRALMATMVAMGVKENNPAYQRIDTILKKDQRLTPEDIRDLLQFRENIIIIANIEAQQTAIENLKSITKTDTLKKTEMEFEATINSFLNNPLNTINKSVLTKASIQLAEVAKQIKNKNPRDPKNEFADFLLNMIPGYSTREVISKKGMNISEYTLKDLAVIGLDIASIIPAVKLISIGAKVFKVASKTTRVINTLEKTSRFTKANKISEIGGRTLLVGGYSSEIYQDFKALDFKKIIENGETKTLVNILINTGALTLTAVAGKYILNKNKLTQIGKIKEFGLRVGDRTLDSAVEAHLKTNGLIE